MTKRPKTVSVSLDDPLHDAPRQPTSLSLPVPVHHRLDVAADKLHTMGASRTDIIGMLVAELDLEDERLVQRWVEYRSKRVRDVLPSPPVDEGPASQGDNVVDLPVRRPGRPRTSAG
jgi:hypothetical protein